MSGHRFMGWLRPDGSVGIRNAVGILSAVSCANQAADAVAAAVYGASPFTHQQGCGLSGSDLALTERTLVGIGRNPNLGAVVLVALGCEGVDTVRIAEGIAASGKRVEIVRIRDRGSYRATIADSRETAQRLAAEIARTERVEAGLRELRVGIKCGGSDPTSGIAANPAVGRAVDLLLAAGGSVVFGETTEVIGAEHILARRCRNEEVAGKLLAAVAALEKRVLQGGGDIRGGNPSKGNIEGGLTTLEEKSLGAIVKSGTAAVDDVFAYGEAPPAGPGLFFVDTPGREPEMLTALAAAGCQLILFSTGLAVPQGFPFVPVVKVCGNSRTAASLADFVDIDVSGIVSGELDPASAGSRILDAVAAAAAGTLTKAEEIGFYGSTAIHQLGPIV